MELVPAYVLAVAIDSLLFDERAFDLPWVPVGWLPAQPSEQLLLSTVLIGGAYLLGAVLSWVNGWAWNRFAQEFQHTLRVATYDAMQRRELGFFEENQTGEIMSILNNDVNQLEGFLTDSLNSAIQIVVRTGGMAAVMLVINWQLGIIPTLVIPLLAYVSYRFVTTVRPKYRAVRAAVGSLNSRLENNLGGIQTIKAYTTEPFETVRVERSSDDYRAKQWEAIKDRIRFRPTIKIVTGIGYVATFLVGGWWVMFGPPHPLFSGTLTAGTLVLFLSYSRRFMHPLREFGTILDEYQYAEAAGERVHRLLETRPDIVDREDAIELSDVDGRVSFEAVSFGYPTGDGGSEPALRDVTFEIDPGQFVGVVGPTGAGKSTLLKLLLRLYEPDHGTIRLDGDDIRSVSLRSLRTSIGYVGQEPFLFTGTVRENVTYGAGDPSNAEVEAAARTAGAHEFVRALPHGYETQVGERGVKLSGGQRQRLSIARAILRDPALFVLDEATSHVDNGTEAIIQRNLADIVTDRTTFAVAHRLSTIRHADVILAFDDGVLCEAGTHEELLAADGLYAALWRVHVGAADGTGLVDP